MIKGAYLTKINDESIFTQEDAIAALRKLHDSNATNFTIEFAPERRLDASQLQKVLTEHNLFNPSDPDDSQDHVPTLSIPDIRAIAAIRHPGIDFSETSISTEEVGVVINAITSHAITPEEQALGRFTRRKLKKLST